MSTRRKHAIQVPGHIQEVITEIGHDHIMWSTPRREKFAPEPGGGVDELSNGIVRSPVTATQGTPSDQPIWQGPYYDYGGDDHVDLTGHVTDLSDGITVACVAKKVAATGDLYLFGGRKGDGSANPKVLFFARDDGDYFATYKDSTGAGGFAGVSATNTDQQVVVMRGSVDGDIVTDLWVGSTRDTSNPEAKAGTLVVDSQRIGAAVSPSGLAAFQWEGAIWETLVVPSALPVDLIEGTLIPGLEQSWGIT